METYVFVYGTLKRGFFNYNKYLDPAEKADKARFIGEAKTSNPSFNLVLKKDRYVPCLYRAENSSEGYQVPGEVYLVDNETLEVLDILEGVKEKMYNRETEPVEITSGDRSGEKVDCQCYIMDISEALTSQEKIYDYTAEMHKGYKSRKDAPKAN